MRPAVRQLLYGGSPKLLFSLSLLSSLIPEVAAGSPTPTFSRTTTATVDDFEGNIRLCKSGEARFRGARRVENLLEMSEDFTNGIWLKAGATNASSANTINFPNFNETIAQFDTTQGGAIGTKFSGSAVLSGSGTIYIGVSRSGSGAYEDVKVKITLTSTPTRYSTGVFTIANSNQNGASFFISRGADGTATTVIATKAMLEVITSQSNVNPSEYVSTGKLSAPFHGAGVDGVKYFEYQNGNTVSSNVVTEAVGPAISSSILKGYLSEGARTNYLLNSSSPATQTTGSLPTGTYTLWVVGSGSAAVTAGTMTASGLGTATAGSPVTFTVSVAGTAVVTVTGSLTRFQLENGPDVSSYIPTAGTALARNADSLYYDAVNNFHQDSSTVALEQINQNSHTVASCPVQVSDGSTDNSLYCGQRISSTAVRAGYMDVGSVSNLQFSPTAGSISAGAGDIIKTAISYKSGLAVGSVNGTMLTKDTTVLTPSVPITRINIGSVYNGNQPMFGNIRRVRIWGKLLSDLQLQKATL